MNKVFKVIWSEARNAYVVVSEIAKNHGSKSCSTKKLLTMLIATGVMTCASMAPAMAAPNVDASATVNVGEKAVVAVEEQAKVNVEEGAELTVNNGAKVTFSKDAGVGFDNDAKVKLGNKAGVNLADGATLSVAQGSNVSVAENITMGKGANVAVWNGVTGKNITGDIAVGPNAHAWNGEYSYGSEGRIGSKEYLLDFGQGGVVGAESFLGITYKYKVADGSKIAGSIAIGKNTLARTGSVMLGDHSYTGELGDIEINPENPMTYNDGIYSTTLGAGAYNSGSLAAVTGALSIASGSDTKNTGATIYGSMNSIESATSNSIYSGVASSVLGFANRTQNANAALIWGTGNEVTNSIEEIGIKTNWNNVSVAEAQQKAIKAMQSSEYAGGSVLAIGGGNKADYAKYSQLTGVQNKVTGTKNKVAKYDFVNGYQNTVTEASDVTVIGIKNEVTADGNKVIGDNHKVSGKNNVIFGSVDKSTETTVDNAVVLGYNAKVTGEGGVALGAGSVADRAAEVVGYDPVTGDKSADESSVWKANAGAVSIGSSADGEEITRQITNVAAGTEDTDAVNVAQLKNTNQRINGVENQVISNSNRINQLGNRVNKVGAGAAALAALHPMDFDPDDKLTFSAGYGNYGGENAAAIGAYYRPDEKVMFSVAGTVGNGENMVNAGVSFALDRTNHVSNSRTALAREVIDLRGQLAVMGAKMAKMEKAFGMLDETKTKLFPDVPANHWAYEYIAKLAGNGYIEGYPDGNFGGDRLMTRYEFAAMLYRAIEKGAALEEKIIKEFEPELGRIRVDRISGEDGDRDKIERVRVNDTKGERDHYGNKLAK